MLIFCYMASMGQGKRLHKKSTLRPLSLHGSMQSIGTQIIPLFHASHKTKRGLSLIHYIIPLQLVVISRI